MTMKTSKPVQYALGVNVTNRDVNAVLLKPGSSGTYLLRYYTQPRAARHQSAQPAAAGTPSFAEDPNSSDFTIQFGEAPSSGSELFLKNEFSGVDVKGRDGGESAEAAQQASAFAYELSEILEKCREDGFGSPALAFCLSSADMTHVELRIAAKESRKGSRESKQKQVEGKSYRNGTKDTRRLSREQLLSILEDQHKPEVEKELVAFLPMTPGEEGEQRHLALYPRPGNAILSTLNMMRAQKDEPMPAVRLLDTDASLYLAFARSMVREDALREIEGDGAGDVDLASRKANTLIVRAGAEDTLVMFLQGETIRHYESLRSLTVFDSPDTICSRVLLLQDEYGIEEVGQVLIVSEVREPDLIESFRMFFPDAEVRSLRKYVTLDKDGEEVAVGGAEFPAVGAGLRLVEDHRFQASFEPVNLLPRKLMRGGFRMRVHWNVPIAAALLFLTAFFFGGRFVLQESKISSYREDLRKQPPELTETDPRILQARIDSLRNAYNGYMKALDVLDTLLVGSDQWSRTLESISQNASAVKGIWIERWAPSGYGIQVSGSAISRERVVAFADKANADIESLVFSEIREMPVYTFSMQIPVKRELPQAALYLRQQAVEQLRVNGLVNNGLPVGDSEPTKPKLVRN